MPGSTVRVAKGSTLTAGTSTFTMLITSIRLEGLADAPPVDVSHMGTAVVAANKYANITKKAIGLVDGGRLVVSGFLNPDVELPIKGVEETWTLTFALITGDATSTIWAFTGAGNGMTMTGEHKGVYTCEYTIEVLSTISITDAT